MKRVLLGIYAAAFLAAFAVVSFVAVVAVLHFFYGLVLWTWAMWAT